MLKCTIFNIQRFSTHDGEGIRTNIFFKGCPLRCKWCSNPESQSVNPELIYDEKLCRNFLDCTRSSDGAVSVSEQGLKINRKLMGNLKNMHSVCPSRAMVVTGEEKSVDELLEEIEKDLPFYKNSRGGVTFTGGEPFLQDEALNRLASLLKQKGIHTAIETCLHFPWEKIGRFTGIFDEFLVDVKHTDAQKFRKYTGGDLMVIMGNLSRLLALGARVIARVPVIPRFNFSDPELKTIIDYIRSLNEIREIHFIPYHSLGARKYEMLGREYEFGDTKPVLTSDLQPWVEYANKTGLKANIGG
jgi:pyruvate formate lyase activating enzyme